VDVTFDEIKESMRRCAAVLRDTDVPYALGGSVAGWARGGPQTCRDLDFTGPLQIVRALREQIDFEALARTTAGSPYARAFLTLAEELDLTTRPDEPAARSARW
jgi:hypothetical protein